MVESSEAEETSSAWLVAIVGATLCWGIADVMCDICIGEDDDDEEEDEEVGLELASMRHQSGLPRQRSKSISTSSTASSLTLEHLSGEQDCAVAGLVTFAVMYILSIRRTLKDGILHGTISQKVASPSDSGVPVWSPWSNIEWWVAALGGVLLFFHYLTLLWAYDTAPSTLITPLLQVSSTWVLLGSAIPAAITGTTFIRPFDLVCYAIIFAGGLLPSIEENGIRYMFTKAFWKKALCKVHSNL